LGSTDRVWPALVSELTLADFHVGESENPGTDGTFFEHEAS
jgi:hypothetical protein